LKRRSRFCLKKLVNSSKIYKKNPAKLELILNNGNFCSVEINFGDNRFPARFSNLGNELLPRLQKCLCHLKHYWRKKKLDDSEKYLYWPEVVTTYSFCFKISTTVSQLFLVVDASSMVSRVKNKSSCGCIYALRASTMVENIN
jgi:hypothetical protein